MAIDVGTRSGMARNENSAYRGMNIILGIWLFISAFIWQHTPAQFTNTWIMGVIITVFGLIALSVPNARYVNTVASIWLFISAWMLRPERAGTVWNNVIVALLVFFISLAPAMRAPTTGRMPTQPV